MSWKQWRAVYHAVSIVNSRARDARFSRMGTDGVAPLLCVTQSGVCAKWLAISGKEIENQCDFVEMARFLLRSLVTHALMQSL